MYARGLNHLFNKIQAYLRYICQLRVTFEQLLQKNELLSCNFWYFLEEPLWKIWSSLWLSLIIMASEIERLNKDGQAKWKKKL